MNDKIGPLMVFSQTALDNVCGSGNPTIIAAGPLSKPDGYVAFRVVLVSRDVIEPMHSHWIVWNQNFPNFPDCRYSQFHTGEYFAASDLVKATQRFAERVGKDARLLATLLRDEDREAFEQPMSDYEYNLIYKDK